MGNYLLHVTIFPLFGVCYQYLQCSHLYRWPISNTGIYACN